MKPRSLKMSKELEASLRARAKAKGVSDSFVMREALVEYLAESEAGSEKAPRSFAALASDLAGCVDGPSDLSTDSRHLNQFGR
ncbi:MAG: hypothetical protein HQ485_08875 [Acidobacteria bacterium]|jgi:predicted transcriptional regulator|nr:hypothetical protein [Acidobacteriota bacterium]